MSRDAIEAFPKPVLLGLIWTLGLLLSGSLDWILLQRARYIYCNRGVWDVKSQLTLFYLGDHVRHRTFMPRLRHNHWYECECECGLCLYIDALHDRKKRRAASSFCAVVPIS